MPPAFYLLSPPLPAARNMAVDETLTTAAAHLGAPVLRLYSWSEPAATFGYFQEYAEVERATRLRPLVRRPTGGGIVPHDADWTYSFAVPAGTPWYELRATASYCRIHRWVAAAFAALGVTAELAPRARKTAPGQRFAGYERDDVLWQGRKIAGAAQRRTREGLLIQGSVQPPPLPLDRKAWERAMLETALPLENFAWSELVWGPALEDQARQLAETRYGQDSYNRKR